MARSKEKVGSSIAGPDNNTWMWDDDDPGVSRCPVCHVRTDFFRSNPFYRTRKRSGRLDPELVVAKELPFVSTYDEQSIVSNEFRMFCESERYTALNFGAFNDDPSHFHLQLLNEVKLDPVLSGVVYDKLCPTCGNYESVAIRYHVRGPVKYKG